MRWREFFIIGVVLLCAGCGPPRTPIPERSQSFQLKKDLNGALIAEIHAMASSRKASITLLNASEEDDYTKVLVTERGVFFNTRGESIFAQFGESVIADKAVKELVVLRQSTEQ